MRSIPQRFGQMLSRLRCTPRYGERCGGCWALWVTAVMGTSQVTRVTTPPSSVGARHDEIVWSSPFDRAYGSTKVVVFFGHVLMHRSSSKVAIELKFTAAASVQPR